MSFDDESLDDLLGTLRRLLAVDVNPFSSYLEAPRPIIDLYQQHGAVVKELGEQWRAAVATLALDLAAARWPELADVEARKSHLRSSRVAIDPTPEPYWGDDY